MNRSWNSGRGNGSGNGTVGSGAVGGGVGVGVYGHWYLAKDGNSTYSIDDILQNAFEQAKSLLQPLLEPRDLHLLFPHQSGTTNTVTTNSTPGSPFQKPSTKVHTLEDIQGLVEEARAIYEDRTGLSSDLFRTMTAPSSTLSAISPSIKYRRKARFWLTDLSEKIVHYGNIFDVLVQHHHEYVSLAWGTFKLLFVAIKNHAESAAKLGKAISQIADILPHHQVHLTLYPTDELQIALARLYAHVLKFFVLAYKWYADSRASHAIKSIFQPWDLQFKSEFESIAAESRRIELLADVASKAELRDTRLEVVHGSHALDLLRQDLTGLKSDNVRLEDLFGSRLDQLERSLHGICNQISVDLASQHATLERVHLNQMLSLPVWSSLPTSGESLQFCRSIRSRSRGKRTWLASEIYKLNLWGGGSGSGDSDGAATTTSNESTRGDKNRGWSEIANEVDNSNSNANNRHEVLFIDSQASSMAKVLLMDMVNLMLENKKNIIWALRFSNYQDHHITIIDIMRMLVLQAIQQTAETPLLLHKNNPYPVTVEHLRAATSLRDWSAILCQVLKPSQSTRKNNDQNCTFIALDADLMAHATSYDRSGTMEMLDVLRNDMGGHVKIVTAINSVTRSYADALELSHGCVKVHPTTELDQKARHRKSTRRVKRPQRY